jgi:peptidoglycan hydrolase-like protein with peptidoglycan-binding domain
MRVMKLETDKEDLMKNNRIIATALMTLIALFLLCAWMPRQAELRAESKPYTTPQPANNSGQPEDERRVTPGSTQAEPIQNPLKDSNASDKTPSAAVAGSNDKIIGRQQILEAEQRLATLGYWTGPIDGVLDEVSRQALVAFQKVEGRKRTGVLTTDELQALRTGSRPLPLYSGAAHVEVDLRRQVLFVVDGEGTVEKVLAISSGSGNSYVSEGKKCRAVTPVGHFAVYNKISGYRRAPLGLIYYPSYFDGGFAIHGSASVPAYPASHGCVRVPMFAAKQLSEMTPLGMDVIVHDGKATENKSSIPAA